MPPTRTQERAIDPGGSGIRWFELKGDLAEFGQAAAYPTVWQTSQKRWARNTSLPAQTVYSVTEGVHGKEGDFVPAWLNARSTFWEVLHTTAWHHVAKVPATGIPARVDTTPGTAVCAIWRVVLGAPNTLEDTGLVETIYNIYPISVAFNAFAPYFQITKDKFGRWLNESPQVITGFNGIPFYNASGFTIPPGGCMAALDTVTIDTIPHILSFRPGSRFDRYWLINNVTAVADGATGLGSWLTDLTGYVALDDSAHTPGTRITWGPKPGSFGLAQDRLGFSPLTAGDFTINGQRCGYFKQHVINDVFGKYYEQLEQGGKADFEIYYRNAAGKIHPAGWDKIEVHDFWLQRNGVVEAGTKGKAHWYCGNWEADLTGCEVDDTDTGSSMSRFADANLALGLLSSLSPAGVGPLTLGLPIGSVNTF